MNWKGAVTAEQIGRYRSDLLTRTREIPGFVDAYFGENIDSSGGKFTHGGAIFFDSVDSAKAAKTHPAHEAIGAFEMPLISELIAVDLRVSRATTEAHGS